MHSKSVRGGLVAAVSAFVLIFAASASYTQETASLGAAAELAAKGVWNASTTYAKDDIVTARGSAWISLRNNNINRVPGQTQPSTATFWRLFARGFNPTGAWSNATKYQPDDLVTHNGQTFRAKITNTNKQPTNTNNWELLATKGATGATGATGPAGPNTGISAGSKSAPGISFGGDTDTGIYAPTTDKIAMVEGGVLFLHNLGTQNTALGLGSLNSNISGLGNTALGHEALAGVTNGSVNTALGVSALRANTGGNNNTAVGSDTLAVNTTGNGNVAVGSVALGSNTTASFNIAIGVNALTGNQTGENNVAVGHQALQSSTTADNTAIGHQALTAQTTGFGNTAVGATALAANTSGDSNTAVGVQALAANTTGQSNTAVGQGALDSNTTGGSNTAVGKGALDANTTGGLNTAVGRTALTANTTGISNTAIGAGALIANTTGLDNTAVGQGALDVNTTGSSNTVVGRAALDANTTGGGNIAVGNDAGGNAANPNNSIFIGNEGLVGDSLTIKIGTQGTQTSTFIAGIHGATSTGGIGVFVNSDGQLGTATSSRRYKDDIEPIGGAGATLAKLRPVTFRYKQADADGSRPRQYGLIAEEVEDVSPDLAAYNKDGAVETVKYHFLPPLLLAGWQAQQQTIEALAELDRQKTEKIEAQAGEIADLKQRLAGIEAMLPRVTKAAAR